MCPPVLGVGAMKTTPVPAVLWCWLMGEQGCRAQYRWEAGTRGTDEGPAVLARPPFCEAAILWQCLASRQRGTQPLLVHSTAAAGLWRGWVSSAQQNIW